MAQADKNQQAVMNQMVYQCLGVLYDPKQAAAIKNAASQPDGAETIAGIVAQALKVIQQAAQEAGHKAGLRYVGPAGQHVIKQLVVMLIEDFKLDPQKMQQLGQQATETFMDIVSGGQGQSQQQPQQQGGMLAQGV